jgi:molybdopterin-guanine dinucleotide biosynthesis protein A
MPVSVEAAARAPLTGLVLAGGRGARMGGVDKGRVGYRGRPLIEWVLDALAPQVDALVISANRHVDDYAAYGYPVVTDATPDYPGPLAGVLAGLRVTTTDWLLVVPCDTPHLPPDLARRLLAAAHASDAPLAVATDGVREHHGCFVIRRELHTSLADYLARGERAIHRWHAQFPRALAGFAPADFVNLNTPAELGDPAAPLGETGEASG